MEELRLILWGSIGMAVVLWIVTIYDTVQAINPT